MAGGKEIRTKIKSVKNTQKITRAMEKVAMSKMRRAQERMRAAGFDHVLDLVIGEGLESPFGIDAKGNKVFVAEHRNRPGDRNNSQGLRPVDRKAQCAVGQ